MKHLLFLLAVLGATAGVAHAQQSDLMVEQTAPAMSGPDTDVSFSVTLTNLGPDAAADVSLILPLPAGMTFVSQTVPGSFACTPPAVGDNGPIECFTLTLDAGDSASFTFVAHIPANAVDGTFYTSIASATTTNTDPTSENDSSTAVVQTPPPPAADLLVVVEAGEKSNPDTDLTYTINVMNGGPSAATNVVLTQQLLRSPTADPLTGVIETQTLGPTFACVTVADTITCSIAMLDAGASASFTLTGHVPVGVDEGSTYQVIATLSSDNDPNTENDEGPSSICVQTDSCAAGPCNANFAVVCPDALDACHEKAMCNPITGVCPASPPKANDTPCDDGNACTATDACSTGVCVGSDPVVCPAATQCQDQGTCDVLTGTCAANTAKTDGAGCNDGSACTQNEECMTGVCSGGTPLDCSDGDDCTVDTCSATLGCINVGECEDAGVAEEDAGTEPAADGGVGVDAGMPGSDGGPVMVADAGGSTAGTSGGSSGMGGGSAGIGSELDASTDAAADGGSASGDDDGCSCRVGIGSHSHSSGAAALLSLLTAMIFIRRTRRRG